MYVKDTLKYGTFKYQQIIKLSGKPSWLVASEFCVLFKAVNMLFSK